MVALNLWRLQRKLNMSKRRGMHSNRVNKNQDSNFEYRSADGVMTLRRHGSCHDIPNAKMEEASRDSAKEIPSLTSYWHTFYGYFPFKNQDSNSESRSADGRMRLSSNHIPSAESKEVSSDSEEEIHSGTAAPTKRVPELKNEADNSQESYVPPSKTESSPGRSSKRWVFYLIATVTVIVLIAGYKFCLPMLTSDLSVSEPVNERAVQTFTNELNTLKTKFPTQSTRTWKTISAVVRATLSRQPLKAPGIITITATSDVTRIANCFGRRVAMALKNVYNDSDLITLNGDTYSKDNASEAKLKMDQKIRKGLEDGGHVVFFENFLQIPPASSVLFHGLCDNDNAPFKQAIYIFTVQSDDNHVDVQSPEVTKKWMTLLDESLRSSLESRIGNSVVTINNEIDEKHICE